MTITLTAAANPSLADGPVRPAFGDLADRKPGEALAIARAYEVALPANPSLLEPADWRDRVWREDRFYLHANGRIEARSVRDGGPAWRQPAPSRALPALLGSRGRVLIFASPYEVMGLGYDDGAPAWKLGDFPAVADAPHVDPEWIRAWKHHALSDSRLFSASDRDELICTEVDTGRTCWRVPTPERVSSDLVANEAYCAYLTRRGGRTDIVIRRAADGRVEHTLRPPDRQSVQALYLAPDGSLIAIAFGELLSYEPKTGRLKWRAASAARWLPASIDFGEGLLVGLTSDGRMCAVDLASGRTMWQSDPPEAAGVTPGWLAIRDAMVFRVAGRAIQVLAASDGEEIVRRSGAAVAGDADPPQQPVFLHDGFVLASMSSGSGPIPDGRQRTLHVSLMAHPLERGRTPLFQSVELGPFRQPRAIVIRNGGVVVVDGRSLIGYVPTTASRPAG